MLPLSSRLWGESWRDLGAWAQGGVRARVSTFDEALPFLVEHLPTVFKPNVNGRFLRESFTAAKQRWGAEMDVFLFELDDRPVGIFLGHPLDWSSYYIRSAVVLPEVRSRGIAGHFTETLGEMLHGVGVERIEADCVSLRGASLRILLAQGWIVTGNHSSERWGNTVHVTKFLGEDAQSAFAHQFCATEAAPSRPSIPAPDLARERITS